MVKKLGPDVLFLQEAWIFEYLPLGISWDFKELLLDALGDDYKEVVTNEYLLDIDLLTSFGVRIKDQDVIIAKKHVKIVGEPKTIIFWDQFTTPPIPDPLLTSPLFILLALITLSANLEKGNV